MELGLQSLFGLLITVIIGWDPVTPPPPPPRVWPHIRGISLWPLAYNKGYSFDNVTASRQKHLWWTMVGLFPGFYHIFVISRWPNCTDNLPPPPHPGKRDISLSQEVTALTALLIISFFQSSRGKITTWSRPFSPLSQKLLEKS
jgi:hypothetical protein